MDRSSEHGLHIRPRVSLGLALTTGKTASDPSVAAPFPVKEGYILQRFVWRMEGIKLRKALAEIIVSKKWYR